MIFFFILSFFIIFSAFFILISNAINLTEEISSNKIHIKPAKLVGGLIIYFTIISTLFIYETSYLFRYSIVVSSVILLIGLVDDIYNISYVKRIFFQIFISSLIVGNGLLIRDLGYLLDNNSIFYLGYFAYLITILSIVGLTNAINFIDGIDGLASAVILNSIFTIILFHYFAGFFYGEIIHNELIIIIITISLFLLLNITNIFKFKIFLGDAGSNFLGFFLANLLILYTMQENRLFHPVLAPWCVCYPVYDMLNVILQRVSKRKNPFLRDNSHLHTTLFLLFRKNQIKVLIFIIFFSMIMSFLGLALFIFIGPLFSLLSFIILFIPYFLINKYLFQNVENQRS
jgi:UDP-GlcNAc:undecaprenyl-phosphate/decaprenyl-phosphate GlcNAc-1-phosphate transferase